MCYDGLLLDHDGVLVRVLEAEQRLPRFRQQLLETLQRDNIEVPDDDVIETLSGGMSYEKVLELSEQIGLAPDRLWRYRDDTFADVLLDAAHDGHKRPYDDVRSLSRLDLPLGVASNNQTRVVESILDQYDLDDTFQTIHAREPTLSSLQEKKPRPTYLKRGMEDLGITNPLYVGDKESDIVAGKRAGIDTAFIRREHNESVSLAREPTYEVRTLDDVATICNGKRDKETSNASRP